MYELMQCRCGAYQGDPCECDEPERGERKAVEGTATTPAQRANVAFFYGWTYGFFVGFCALMAFAREWWLWVPATATVVGSFVQMGLFVHRHKEVRSAR